MKGPSDEEVAEKRDRLREESPFSNPDSESPSLGPPLLEFISVLTFRVTLHVSCVIAFIFSLGRKDNIEVLAQSWSGRKEVYVSLLNLASFRSAFQDR